MPDQSLYSKSQPQSISQGLQNFIDSMVEEILLEGRAFDTQKKYLKKFSENEGLDYATLENNLLELFETLEELKSHESKAVERLAKMLAKDCYLKEGKVDELLAAMNEAREKEAKRIAAEKKAEEERIAAEKAKRKAEEEARRKAEEEAERRRAREEAERKAKEEKKQTKGELNGHEYVDLGLPSGTLWATCNVGANTPEGNGNYCYWDETNNALASWGNGWTLPKQEQWEELLKYTKNIWTKKNGVNGRLFTANNGQSLFLPAAGYRWGYINHDDLCDPGAGGYYWSSSRFGNNLMRVMDFRFSSNINPTLFPYTIEDGRTVRLVHSS